MKTLARPLAALVLLAGLSAPAAALWPFGDAKPVGPLGAVLAEVSGTVNVKKSGAEKAASASAQTALDAGDVVTTAAGGRAVIAFLDGSKMQIKENSTFAVAGHSAKKVSVKIDVGTLQFWIAKQARRRRYEMRTPTAVASVRGTEGDITVMLNGESSFNLYEGGLNITDNRGNDVRLDANQTVTSDDQTGLQDAKVEALPPEKKGEPEPQVTTPEPKKEEAKADVPPDAESGDASVGEAGQQSSPTQDIQSPVSGSTP